MTQLENITNNCDGYSQIDPEKLDSFKQDYFYIKKEEEYLFPFIYKHLNKGILPYKCIILIKKNELIQVQDSEKTLYHL